MTSSIPHPVWRRMRMVLAWVLIVICAGGLARLAWVVLSPPMADRELAAQVAFLDRAIIDGSATDMQRYFPEGQFFMHALTGLAATTSNPALAREQLAAMQEPEIAGRFGEGMSIEHGIFHAGWSLALAVEIAKATGTAPDLAVVRQSAPQVARALIESPTAVPESYPGGYWPCDAVVAAAAVAQAGELLQEPELISQMRTWRSRITTLLDPQLQLLPHRVDESGATQEGPRGSSQSLIQAFWAPLSLALDGDTDRASWRAFGEAFIVDVGPLVGVREYPVGAEGGGDEDSGPLIAGVSLSASAVTLAAARANGDEALAADLDREAELLGAPFQIGGQRLFAAGLMPIGDAFVAWARAVPMEQPQAPTNPRVNWWVLAIPGLAGMALGVLLLRSLARSTGLPRQ